MSLARRLRGSALVAAELPGQRRLPYAARETIEARRDGRVRAIVDHAARTVPFYRELFARERLDPRDFRSAGDLARLPMLDRDVVRAEPRRFLSEDPAALGALAFKTSGTTGSPLEVAHDRRSLLANIAWGERERAPGIAICGVGFRPREVYVGSESSTFRKVIAFYGENVLFPVRPRRRWISVLQPIAELAAVVDAERPDVLVGYGGWLALYFRTLAARGLDVHRPKMVVYMAEALPPGARELIEGHFGVPVLSRYSAAEAFKIGFYCERRTGFHLHEDLCHVRVVGADGRDAADGDQGRIVLSNLVNRASVLLNYPIGDLAALAPGECPCGRTLRRLSELEGRVEDILPLASGGHLHPRAVFHVFKDDAGVLQYQLTQHELRRFELSLVTLDGAGFQRALGRALPELRRLLGTDVRIDAARVDAFDRSANAKFRAVQSRCAAG